MGKRQIVIRGIKIEWQDLRGGREGEGGSKAGREGGRTIDSEQICSLGLGRVCSASDWPLLMQHRAKHLIAPQSPSCAFLHVIAANCR